MKTSRILVEALLIFLAFFLPGYIAQAAFSAAGPVTSFMLLQSIATGIPQFLLMAYIAGAFRPPSAPGWGLAPLVARDAMRIPLIVVACFSVVTPFFLLVAALPPSWSQSLSRGYRWELAGPIQLPLGLLFGLTAGYREEFFFRAYLLRRLDELAVPRRAAVALSTALFCVGHVYEGPLGVAIAAALGLVFALAYLRWGNLHVIAIAHGLYNTAVLALGVFLPRALPAATVFRGFWS